ncbi:hypothetical protein PoB_000258200, partial [Plakobranchus ocellatus]
MLRRNQRLINPRPDKAVIFPTDVSGNMEMQHQDRTECGIGDNNSSSPMGEPQSSPPQPRLHHTCITQHPEYLHDVAE